MDDLCVPFWSDDLLCADRMQICFCVRVAKAFTVEPLSFLFFGLYI